MHFQLWFKELSGTVKYFPMRFYSTCLNIVVDPSLPQVLQPSSSDPEGPVSTRSLGSLELKETSLHQLPPGVTVRNPPSPLTESFVVNEQMSSQASSSPRSKRDIVRKLSSCRDPQSFPEVDFPVKYVLPDSSSLNHMNK